ncbi:MAG: hypothetical protein RLZZ15_3570, partial [Verrucomicrobiota bacterium]
SRACEAFEFHRVYQLCNQFCSVTLSATYHDILKDRLYTLGTDNPLRRSSQTAIHHIFGALARLLAPFIPFTADEAWAYATTRTEFSADSIHLQDWPVAPAEWTSAEVEAEFAALLRVRAQVTEAIEPLRAAGQLGKSLDAAITISGAPADAAFATLTKHAAALAEIFIVSEVRLEAGAAPAPVAAVQSCAARCLTRCPRCWRHVPALANTPHGDVCPRCVAALRP